MEKFKKILKRSFCPPPLWTAAAALFGYGLIIAVAVFHVQNPFLRYASYLASAYALTVTVSAAVRFFRKRPLTGLLRSTAVGERYLTDAYFRNRVSLYTGLAVNLAYIVLKLAAGVYYRSAWFVALAVYYILLAAMRFLLVRRLDVQDEASELRRYRLCGILLLLMNQALAGIVVFMVHQDRGFAYPGFLIYAMAAYSFYAVTVAVINIVKTRRHKSPILSAAKAVNLVAALVSLLSLTTAMLAQFGGEDDPAFRRTMTACTGGGVCTAVIAMAIYMICRAGRALKSLPSGPRKS